MNIFGPYYLISALPILKFEPELVISFKKLWDLLLHEDKNLQELAGAVLLRKDLINLEKIFPKKDRGILFRILEFFWDHRMVLWLFIAEYLFWQQIATLTAIVIFQIICLRSLSRYTYKVIMQRKLLNKAVLLSSYFG